MNKAQHFALILSALILAAGSMPAAANHNADAIHVCIGAGPLLRLAGANGTCPGGAPSVALVSEAALEGLQAANVALQTRVDSLESLVARLHGHKAAVNELVLLSGFTTGAPGSFGLVLSFCNSDDNDCRTVEVPMITESDEGTIISIDATTHPTDFPVIATRLSDAVNDRHTIETTYYTAEGNFGASTSRGLSDKRLFYNMLQTTTTPGLVDLVGLEIQSIEVALDDVQLTYNSSLDRTNFELTVRLFFMLAD